MNTNPFFPLDEMGIESDETELMVFRRWTAPYMKGADRWQVPW